MQQLGPLFLILAIVAACFSFGVISQISRIMRPAMYTFAVLSVGSFLIW